MLFTVMKTDYVQLGNSQEGENKTYRTRYLATELFEIPICTVAFSNAIEHNKTSPINAIKPLGYLLKKNIGLLIVMLVGLVFFNAHLSNVRQAEAMLLQPQVDDLYFADLHSVDPRFEPQYRYSIMQVEKVDKNTVTARIGSMLHTTKLSPFQYLTKGAYSGYSLISSNTIEIPRSALRGFYESGVFYNMKRPEGELIDGWLSTKFLHVRDCEMCNELRYK